MNQLAPFSERLQTAIAARGCSIAECAREMGTPGYPMEYLTVWRWIHKKTTPSRQYLRVADAWIERNTP